MSDDLIRREDAIKAAAEVLSLNRFASFKDIKDFGRFAERMLRNVPSTDRPQGEWEMQEDADGLYGICSVCGQDADFSHYYKAYNFCPHCGAKMKGADDE